MKVIFTKPAAAELDEILANLRAESPTGALSVEARVRAVISRIRTFPDGARRVVQRPDVRVVPLVRYPYLIFYRVTESAVEILHVRHSARRPPPAR